MSDSSPDPYAVGGQLEDTRRATARPPSSPIPFLVALAVFAWAGPGQLWNPMIRDLLDKVGAPPRAFATFGLVMALTGLLKFIWAHLSDRVPLMESRRQGHLVVACMLAAAAWLAAPFVPRAYEPWLAIGAILMLAVEGVDVICGGALVELARRRRASGRLATAMIVVPTVAQWLWPPVRALLGDHLLGWAGLALVLTLSVTGLALVGPDAASDRELPADEPPVAPFRRFLKTGRASWGFLAIVGCGIASAASMEWVTQVSQGPLVPEDRQLSLVVGRLAGAAAYWFLCRRFVLRRVWVGAALAQVPVMIAVLALGGRLSAGPAMAIAFSTLLEVAGLDLALRLAPRGAEALTFALLRRGAPLLPILNTTLRFAIARGSVAAAGAFFVVVGTALGIAAIRALPASLVTTREGEPWDRPRDGVDLGTRDP
jgi:hypothetical protein